MLGFCSSMEFSFFSFLFLISIFNFLNLLLFFLHLFFCLLFLLFFPPCSYCLMYINLLQLPIFNFAYLFFLSFFSLLSFQHICQLCFHCFISPVGTLLQFCFPVCALISFVLVDIIFGFLGLPCQSIALFFCWTVLILIMGVYVCVYMQSHFLLL